MGYFIILTIKKYVINRVPLDLNLQFQRHNIANVRVVIIYTIHVGVKIYNYYVEGTNVFDTKSSLIATLFLYRVTSMSRTSEETNFFDLSRF